jgi:hypothetical protein
MLLAWTAIRVSLLAGIVAGLLARVAMAIIADAGGSSMTAQVGRLTFDGTARILAVPMLFGIPLAIIYLALGQRWRGWWLPARAGAYAVAALLVPGVPFLTDSEFAIVGPNAALGPILFAPIFPIYGVIVGLVGDWLIDRELPLWAGSAPPPAGA